MRRTYQLRERIRGIVAIFVTLPGNIGYTEYLYESIFTIWVQRYKSSASGETGFLLEWRQICTRSNDHSEKFNVSDRATDSSQGYFIKSLLTFNQH